MSQVTILKLPPDATVTERKIVEYAYAHIYRLIQDPIDKFIVAFMFDLGNTFEATSVATGLSRKTLWKRHNEIKKFLRDMKIEKQYFMEE